MIRFVILCFFVLVTNPVVGQDNQVRQRNFNVNKNIALDGYDPVSYFHGTPREGSDEFKTIFRGIEYRFFSQANANTFKANPEKFEPAYGGWCAFAMGETGEKVKVDPETYKIINGRVYLFYNFWRSNTLVEWNKAEDKLKESADRNWRKFN